jgi:hypothetical protein
MMAEEDPQERVTACLVWVGKWSDGTPARGYRTDPRFERDQRYPCSSGIPDESRKCFIGSQFHKMWRGVYLRCEFAQQIRGTGI